MRELPDAPVGVPDDFAEHVKLMFDLQVLAFASDTTRVFSFKMGRDGSARVYPESGVRGAFHPASHHGEREDRVTDFMKINRYHVSMVPYFLKKLKETPDGDGQNLLDNTLVIYGSPMGNSNVHNHKRCPLFLAGKAGGALRGNLHLKAADGTPMANVFLSVMQDIGMDDMKTFGDSTGRFELKSVPRDDRGGLTYDARNHGSTETRRHFVSALRRQCIPCFSVSVTPWFVVTVEGRLCSEQFASRASA